MNILVTTAGGGNAINLCRSLKHAFPDCFLVGANANKFQLAKSIITDVNYLVPKFSGVRYVEIMEGIVEKEKIDFVIPNHELEIKTIVNSDSQILKDKTFLAKKEVVDLCINKFNLINHLKASGIREVPKSLMLTVGGDELNQLEYPVWLRLTHGAGSQGAFLAHDYEEAAFWVDYWMRHKHVSPSDFMISEYLPGEDHHYFSLWKDGEMIIGKSIKRLEYCCGKYTLTGTSSSPSLCKMVKRKDLDDLTERIIKAVDPKANGLYGIDYKESVDGRHCLTEINIGRFPRINLIFNLEGTSVNIAELYVKCGLKIPFDKPTMDFIYHIDKYLIRDFDTASIIKSFDEIDNYYFVDKEQKRSEDTASSLPFRLGKP